MRSDVAEQAVIELGQSFRELPAVLVQGSGSYVRGVHSRAINVVKPCTHPQEMRIPPTPTGSRRYWDIHACLLMHVDAHVRFF